MVPARRSPWLAAGVAATALGAALVWLVRPEAGRAETAGSAALPADEASAVSRDAADGSATLAVPAEPGGAAPGPALLLEVASDGAGGSSSAGEPILSGEVVDWRGAPVADAFVELSAPPAPPAPGAGVHRSAEAPPDPTARTDASGRFALHAGDAEAYGDELLLTADHAEFAKRVELVRRGEVVRLVLEPLPVLTGRVLIPTGLEPEGPARIRVRVAGRELRTDSQPGGVYRIAGLPVGVLESVDVRAPGAAKLSLELDLPLEPGQTEYLDLHLSRGAVVLGRVVDADTREPVEGAMVWADAARLDDEVAGPTDVTGAEGRFRLESVSPAEHLDEEAILWLAFELHARADRRSRAISVRHLAPPNASDVYEFEIEVRRDDAELVGTVLAPGGGPAVDAAFYVCTAGGGAFKLRSDEEGRFRLTDLSRGPALVLAWARQGSRIASCARLEVDLGPGRNEVRLGLAAENLARIEGSVESAELAVPRPKHVAEPSVSAEASVLHLGALVHPGVTLKAPIGPDGRYELGGLLPVTWRVGTDVGDVAGGRSVELSLGEVLRDVDFGRAPDLVVEGVVDTRGYPAELLVVELLDPVWANETSRAATRLGSGGAFELRSDRPGEHRLVVRLGTRKLVDRRVGPDPIEGIELDLP